MVEAAKTKEKTGSGSEPDMEDLYKMLEVLKLDIQEMSKTIAGVGKAEARRAVGTAKERGQAVREAGEEQYDALRRQAEVYGQNTGEYVRENPVTSLGLAAGFGFFIGFLMRGRG